MTDAGNEDGYNGHEEAALGARIRDAREQSGMTQIQLAQRLGVEPNSLRAWESGTREPRANRLTTLAGMLDVTVPWLLDGRGEGGPGVPAPTIDDLRGDVERLAVQVSDLTQSVEALKSRLANYQADS